MSEDLTYPVIGFMREAGPWDEGDDQRAIYFEARRDLYRATAWTLRQRYYLQMLLIDGRGRSWRVQDVSVRSRRTPIWVCVLLFTLRRQAYIEYGLDLVLEAQPDMPFAEVQRRMCQLIDRSPYYWEPSGGEAGWARPGASRGAMKAAVMDANSLAELVTGVTGAWPGRAHRLLGPKHPPERPGADKPPA